MDSKEKILDNGKADSKSEVNTIALRRVLEVLKGLTVKVAERVLYEAVETIKKETVI